MNSIDDSTLRLLAGKPLIFKDVCLVYSPTLDEIATVGLSKFYQYLSIILIEKPQVEEAQIQAIVKQMTDFEFLLFLSQTDANQYNLIKDAFKFFTHDDHIMFTLEPPSVIFGEVGEKRILNNDTFPEFQESIRMACAMLDSQEDAIVIEEDDSAKLKEIKRKLLKGRQDRIRAKNKNKKGEESGDLRFSDLVASLAIGSNGALNILNIWNLSYYAFQDQLKRMGWREEFDINTRAAMAGAKMGKDKMAHWIKTMTFK